MAQTDFGCMILVVAACLYGYSISTCITMYHHGDWIHQSKVWWPNEFEVTLLCLYSPVHALMWMVTMSLNRIPMFLIMAVLSKQVVLK
jgi:hypothetical protein